MFVALETKGKLK